MSIVAAVAGVVGPVRSTAARAPSRVVVALATAILAAAASVPSAAAAATVDAGSLRAAIAADPWGLTLNDPARPSAPVLVEDRARGTGADGTLGFRTAAGWFHATRAVPGSVVDAGDSYSARLQTTDPDGGEIEVRVEPDARGVMRLSADVVGAAAAVEATGIAFRAQPRERYLGFGERSNAVDQRGNTVENFVGEGPYVPEERAAVAPFVPAWAYHQRDDATYFPMPWLLSTAGYGVLVDNAETSYYRLDTSDGAWGLEVEAERLSLRVFAGPTPAAALRRMTGRTGTQPKPADPWLFGPTFHVGSPRAEERSRVGLLRGGDAPISAVETSPQYLPCGAQRSRGNQYERDRTAWFHSQGLAATSYIVPNVCTNYAPVYGQGAAAGLFAKTTGGDPYVYNYAVRNFRVSQIDFTAPGADDYFGGLLQETIDDGFDGWMEDYGEYTPLDAKFADGTPAAQMHNLYPVLYHRSALRTSTDQDRPIASFVRSGWTGSARYSQLVWGGDPTTDWGYDGLTSAVRNGLTMGTSGVSRWGSDIGGFFAITRQLSPELLIRWIQFGAVSGYMKTRQDGVAVPADKPRPQIWDPEILPQWRRWAKLRTQLYPYLRAADAEYRRSGLPLMRHLALTDPGDPRAVERDDEYMFGPDLLAAPVTEPGATTRDVYLPNGSWIDMWRAVDYVPETGGLRMGAAETLAGRSDATVPAPLGELPLLARAGAVLPLLPADVDTLSSYGDDDPDLVTLADRRDSIELLAFPRGTTGASFLGDERLSSHEGDGVWRLGVEGSRERTYHLQASMRTLNEPMRACAVSLDGVALPDGAWSYDEDTGVLRVEFRATTGTLTVNGSGGRCAPERCKGTEATISGTSGADDLRGTPGRDVIAAGSGDDRVRSLGGRDIVCLGRGDDRASAGDGADRVGGGSGNDRMSGGSGRDRLRGGRGRDRLRGGPGRDRLHGGAGRDHAFGGRGDDRCRAERRRSC